MRATQSLLRLLPAYIRRGADLVLLIARLEMARWQALRGRETCFALSVSSNKEPILRADCAGAHVWRARLHKVSGKDWPPTQQMRRWIARAIAGAGKAGVRIYVWGMADVGSAGLDFSDYAPVIRLETGLFGKPVQNGGAIFSYVRDRRSCYFDGRQQTDLEQLLNACARGSWRNDPQKANLIETIRHSDFQKYDITTTAGALDLGPDDLVVLGQVAGDAAWVETQNAADSNVHLAELALRTIPAHRVFYKAHPFNRTNDSELARIANLPGIKVLPTTTSFPAICHLKPKIAVATSGAGLEAALRGAKIYTFGTAYFANWGFTIDHLPCPRRQNTLDAEDVFSVLIFDYLRYAERNPIRSLPALEAVTRLVEAMRTKAVQSPR